MRADSSVCEELVGVWLLMACRTTLRPTALSIMNPPTNTPTSRPPTRPAMPPSSSASHATSSSSRCCGSRIEASRWEMPKKSASNSHSDWARNPPWRVYMRPGASGSGS